MTPPGFTRFDRAFFERDPLEVAPDLLGALLVCEKVAGRIVETEAYRGGDDPASHAFRGETARNATMFGEAGHLYVYFTYGMHYCANVTCWREGQAGAVLLRALEPICGLAAMRERRPAARREAELCAGPARLCQALGIDRRFDGIDLLARGSKVELFRDQSGPEKKIEIGTRVGLSKRSGEAATWLWRFGLSSHPGLSRHFSHRLTPQRRVVR